MKVLFICDAVKWFDKVNGNTYHSVCITRTSDGATIRHEWTYGYGDSYQQTALEIMLENKWLPEGFDKGSIYRYERDNNYPILWNVHHGLKREMVANGKD